MKLKVFECVFFISSIHSAKYVSAVSSRGVTHGLSLLGLFIYKYVADVSFVTVSCRTSIQGFVSLTMCTYVSDCTGTQIVSASAFVSDWGAERYYVY